jgi:hypothetical protein
MVGMLFVKGPIDIIFLVDHGVFKGLPKNKRTFANFILYTFNHKFGVSLIGVW